ncbi:AAA family ATPase [uncultured Bradyrhizobium sp.]|uniref:AAA family ATPase n=1 Tax=uncultured Bradyrhizobium sp. TaxID=199684 RepID=UPI0035CA95CE
MTERMGVCAIIPAGQNGLQPRVFGMGVVVSGREIVTCAHVVRDVLGLGTSESAAGATVSVCFPFSDNQACCTGTVDGNRWFPKIRATTVKPSDVAVIVLGADQEVPADVEAATLRRHNLTQPGETGPRAYGFRSRLDGNAWRSHPRGEYAVGKIVGSLPGGYGQFDGSVLAGAVVEKGYSGSGVYDPIQDAIVGITAEASRDPDRRVANFIDAASLCTALGIPVTTLDYRVQATLVDQLRNNFVGRVKSIAEIEAWLQQADASAHLVIEAPAGYGKSALMAKLLERHQDWVYHFVREEDQQHTATSMLQSLCAQLAGHPGPRRSYAGLPLADLKDEFFRLQVSAAQRIQPGRKLVIAIDGLDESAGEGSQKLIQPELFRRAHPACRYLISFRQGSIMPTVELGLTQPKTVKLEGLASEDVSELFRLLARTDLACEKTLLEDLIAKTNGEPFYLRFLVEELASKPGPVTIPDDLPADSQDYIGRQVNGLQGQKLLSLIPAALHAQAIVAAEIASAILRVLVIAQDWLSRQQLRSILQGVNGANPILLGALISAIRRYFITERPKNPTDELNERYLISPLRLRDGIRKAFAVDELHEAEMWLLDYCRNWRANQAPYAFNYLSYHLATLEAYDELIATIDHDFLHAKTLAPAGRQGVLTDVGRALGMALSRNDAPKVVRMLLVTAQVRNAIEQEALNGGIAMIAARKLFELAISRATSVSNQEVRFGQLLLVAEAALQNGDSIGLSALDRALLLEIRARQSVRDGAAALIDMLLVRYRDPDRALALAAKVGAEAKDHLQRAAWELMDRDSTFALSLADRIDDKYTRFDTLVEAAKTVGATQPEFARRLIDKAINRSRGAEYYGTVIAVSPLLRQIDPEAGLGMIEEVMAAAQTAFDKDASNRGAGQALNQATAELAHYDLQKALDVALTRCPEIVDSSHTKVTTLSGILTLALEHRIQLDLTTLPMALPVPVPISPLILDDYAAALAVHYIRSGNAGTAGQLTSQIKNDAATAAIAMWSCTDKDCDSAAVSRLLDRGEFTAHGLALFRRGLRQLFAAKPDQSLQALSSIAEPKKRFEACNAVLDLKPEYRSELVTIMTAAVDHIRDPGERFEYSLTLAGMQAGSGFPIPDLLQRSVDAVVPGCGIAANPSAVRTLARLARKCDCPGLASEAVRRTLDVLERRDQGRVPGDPARHIANIVADEAIDLDDKDVSRLFAAVADPYARGRVVANLPRGTEHAWAQLGASPLPLDEFHITIAAAAIHIGDIASARQFVGRAGSPAMNAEILLDIGRAKVDAAVAKSALVECIETAVQAQLARLKHFAQEDLPEDADDDEVEDSYDRLVYEAAVALSRIDPAVALQYLDGLSPWRKGQALGTIAENLAHDPAQAENALGEALQIAMNEGQPVNRFGAIANVAGYAEKVSPDFAAVCRSRALDILPDLDPAERADAVLFLLRLDKSWLSGDELFAMLEAALGKVAWNIPDRRRIFQTATEIRDKKTACRAWTAIITALMQADRYISNDAEIAQAAFELAKCGGKDDAAQVLAFLRERTEDKAGHLEARTYLVLLAHVLEDSAALKSLQQLFDDIGSELEREQGWHYSIDRLLKILFANVSWLMKDDQIWKKGIDLCGALADVGDRTSALYEIIVAALEQGKPALAVSLLERLPVAAYLTEAVTCAAVYLPIETEGDPTAVISVWRAVFDVAQQSAEGTLACAARWAAHYVACAGTADAATATATLLAEIEFVKRQAA